MQEQTREILRQLNAGKKPKDVAAALKIPAHTVYNARMRHSDVFKARKVNANTDGSSPLSKRVFDFIKKYPKLRASHYGDAFVTLGEKKNSVVGTVTHLINSGLVERNPKTMQLTAVAKEYRPMSQTLTHKPVTKRVSKKPVVAKVDDTFEIGQPVYFSPAMKPMSLWGRIKAVFTGNYA